MKRLFIVLLLFFLFDAIAQKHGQPLIDSLLAELPKLKEDTNKVKALIRVAQTYMLVNPNQSFPYVNQGLQLAEKIDWKKGIANAHNTLGLLVGDSGNNTLAREHFEKSYSINKSLDLKTNQVTNLSNIGRSYQRESDFSRAADNYFKALSIAEEMKSSEQIALVATNITVSFYSQKNYAKATEYAEMALKNGELSNTPNNIAKALLQLGTIRMETKDSAASKKYMERALKMYEDMSNKPAMAQVLTNMADLEYPDLKKQLAILLRAQHIYDETSPLSIGSIVNMVNVGQTYYQLAKQHKEPERSDFLNRSESYLAKGKAAAIQTENAEILANVSVSLADLEETKGNYKAALEDFKKYNSINDSIFSQDKKNEIAGLEGKQNIAVKDREIAITKLTVLNQRRTQFGLIVGLALLGIIGGLFYWQSRSRKKANTTLMILNNQLDEANKIKARFFGILSHDLRSPVANLVHFLHLQKESPDLLNTEQQEVHQQNITSSAEGLLYTMEAMLLWSKEQMENFRPNIKQISLSSLFDYIQNFSGRNDKIKIIFRQADGLYVTADENYLRTIMQNLTANAIRALKNITNARIEWSAKKEGNTTILSISDNGTGISADQVKTLFDETTVNNERHGFGLHLVRDLAKAIQYKIAVESEPGKGTTFILTGAAA
ncbi:MAG TPA: ATP-binding protein [Chitinophagaceae bacterium]|nr:ATP-binding protein [Chitinophagaceae bacterium]